MHNRLFLTSTVVLVAVLAFTVVAWGADSNVGTWKLNLGKSTYSPGPAPKSATRIIEAHDVPGWTLGGSDILGLRSACMVSPTALHLASGVCLEGTTTRVRMSYGVAESELLTEHTVRSGCKER
jgi:hypothetical protein